MQAILQILFLKEIIGMIMFSKPCVVHTFPYVHNHIFIVPDSGYAPVPQLSQSCMLHYTKSGILSRQRESNPRVVHLQCTGLPLAYVDEWASMDSNHGTPKRGDLQSPAIATMRLTRKGSSRIRTHGAFTLF